ncbi:MAG TPA: sigma-54 dependent transcriptional regulator [Rhodanobacteraceae bacterium]|nr:sigma-54 dependent transcriptional regulator [Rhodanobacteraceae bacterium]
MKATPSGLHVLIVDDDAGMTRSFRYCLEDADYRVVTAATTSGAIAALGREVVDICVLDIHLGEESGLSLLPIIRQEAPWIRVIMATAENDIDVAVQAIRSGAADYLVKPCSLDALLHAVGQQADARRLEQRIESLQGDGTDAELTFATRSPGMTAVFDAARHVAGTDATILILGESGTGKSVLARAIHDWSSRKGGTLATVSCPSLPAELLESELFGHVKGAFTGAVQHRQGRVQVADGGTLFLDEIGDLPLALQPKLLRFLQYREYERVGDPHTRKADVRVLAATNRDLGEMVRTERFRDDLFYRLNVVALSMPPLRERPEDIEPLADRMLLAMARRYNRPARRFSSEAMDALADHDWPGNLRELRNAIERAVIVCADETIALAHLPFARKRSITAAHGARAGAQMTIEALERAHIEAVVSTASTFEVAARILGIDSSTLYRKRKQFTSPAAVRAIT